MTEKRYTISQGTHIPRGDWQDHNPMDFRHAANAAASLIRAANGVTPLTVWDMGFVAVEVLSMGRVTYDTSLENSEHNYIAAAIRNAIEETKQS